jgi:HAD superfamily hydrolase (TIGR01509 family)
MKPIQALVFDFDGLILDTEICIFQSWQEIYQEYGCHLSFEIWATIIGTADPLFDPLDELERQLGRGVDRQGLSLRQRQRERELILIQPVLPGVEEYLETAKRSGLKIGLASSSSCNWVTGHLSRLGLLEYFDAIKAGDDVHRTKPDPALYRETLQALGVPAGQAIAFEDSPNGIRAAKSAGMLCVAVPNPLTRRLSVDHADLRLASLAEVPLEELLRRIEDL